MSQVEPSQESTHSVSSVGRTPWDFATVALLRLGPTFIVLGFIGAGLYFFYQELNDARDKASDLELAQSKHADEMFLKEREQYQEALRQAQDQLIGNTTEMQRMSKQLIENINDMMNLQGRINQEIDKKREEADGIRNELKESKERIEQAQLEIDQKKTELAAVKAQLEEDTLTLKATRLALEDRQEEIKVEQKKATQTENLLAETAIRLGQAQELESTAQESNVPSVETIKNLLRAYANDPTDKMVQEDLKGLTGLEASLIEQAVSADGLQYDLWLRTVNAIYGYLEQKSDGPRNYIKLFLSKDKKTTKKRIFRIRPTLANVLVKVPKANNVNEEGFFDVIVHDERIDQSWFRSDISPWNQLKIELSSGRTEAKLLFGEPKEFVLSTIPQIKQDFPKLFREWKKRSNRLGRPGLLITMVENQQRFKAASIMGLQSNSFPGQLKPVFENILDAAVAQDFDRARENLASRIGKTILGEIGAMALRDNIEVTDVSQMENSKNAGAQRFAVALAYDDSRLPKGRGTGRLEFVQVNGKWVLDYFDWQSLYRKKILF